MNPKDYLKRLYSFLIKKWDDMHCAHFECSIGDIVLLRKTPNNNQLLLTTRLLDVEDYICGRDPSFPRQNVISRKAYGNAHKEEQGNAHFCSLIESYLKDGYHKNSYVTCDSDLVLMDGNHRMGIHLFEHISVVNVKMVRRRLKAVKGFDWYYKVGLPSQFIDDIFVKYYEIQKWLIETGNTFVALMEKATDNEFDPYNDMSHLVTLLRFYETSFKLDDCEIVWGGVLLFSLDDPMYYSKDGRLFSKRIDSLRQLFQDRYRDRIHFIVTDNCLEGKKLFDRVQTFINNKEV